MAATPEHTQNVKIPFDSLTLCAVVRELRDHLEGGQIQEIRQPAPADLQIGIRSQGRNYLLTLSADARFARLHLSGTRRPNAPTPPAFCMLLRKRLENSFLRSIRQRDFDRIVELEIESRNEAGDPIHYTLIGEFMGKHSNLVLVYQNGVIVDSIKRVTHRINRLRETLPGLPYESPPDENDKISPFANGAIDEFAEELGDADADEIAARLMADFAGMSPFLARELALRTSQGTNGAEGLRTAWREIFGAAEAGDFAPVYIPPKGSRLPAAYPFPTIQLPADFQEEAASLNFALDDAFQIQIQAATVGAHLGDLRSRIDREIKRQEKHRHSLERTIAESERAEEHKQNGELILANIWKIEPHEVSITVQDYFDPELRDRTLSLDPKLTAQENAEACFRRYRKAREGATMAESQRESVAKALTQLAEAKRKADYWSGDLTLPVTTIQELRTELIANGLLRADETAAEESPKHPHLDFQGHKIRRYTIDGYEILVGESATANDFLTTRLSSPNDLWLHVRAAPSAHVVIRTKGQPALVPRSVLERAALLCAQHSGQKHASLVAVDYTLKKYVRKPRGAAPGGADYERETTLHVTPER